MKKYYRGALYPLDKLMRILAKTPLARWEWRLIKGENVKYFSDNFNEWTEAQKMFVHWCKFYDSVFESVERPPDRVIFNDKLLEQWLKQQERETESFAEKNWAKVGTLHDIKTAWNQPEVITFEEFGEE